MTDNGVDLKEILRKEVQEMYTPISVAKEEIWRRWNDAELRKRVENFLNGDIPDCLKVGPKAVMARYIITPNYEFFYFLDLANTIELDYLFFEYSNDKFVAKNPEKYNLCKLFFYNEDIKKGGASLVNRNIVDFNRDEGKMLDEINTVWGGSLIDFHHKLIEGVAGNAGENIVNFSKWFQNNRIRDKQYYYLYYLALFLCHGVLFENFLLDKGEFDFTAKKVLPSFKKLESLFGIKPLIVPLEPRKEETACFWRYYSENVKIAFNKEYEVKK